MMTAVVTAQSGRVTVYRERDTAVGTGDHVTARRALQERGKAAAIEQQERLLAPRHRSSQRVIECDAPGQTTDALNLRGGLQVDQLDGGAGGIRLGPAAE